MGQIVWRVGLGLVVGGAIVVAAVAITMAARLQGDLDSRGATARDLRARIESLEAQLIDGGPMASATSRVEALEQRLDDYEAATPALDQNGVHAEITARRFVLVDERGQTSAVLTSDDADRPSFAMRDTTDPSALEARIVLGWNRDGPALVLVDAEDRRVVLGFDAHAARVSVTGVEGQASASLAMNNEGLPGVLLIDRAGDGRLTIGLRDVVGDARPAIALGGEKDNGSVVIAVAEIGPRIGVLDGNGTPRAILQLADGSPELRFDDEEGKARAGVAFNPATGRAEFRTYGGDPTVALNTE